MNQNTGFEEGAVGWDLDDDDFEIVANNAKTGTYSAQHTGAAGISRLRSETIIPVTEGETFYAEAYIKYSASASSGYSRVVIQAMEGETNTGGANGNVIANTLTSYSKSAASYEVEAGKTHIHVMVFAAKSDSNDTVYIDDVRLFRSASSVLIADGAVNADKMAANSIEAGSIVAGAISTDKLAANAVTTAKLAADSVTAGIIAAGAVSTSELAADAVTAEKIAAGTITSDRIKAGDIQGDRIAANTITGGLIAASGIITSAAQIEDAVITNAKIENLAITKAKIADLAVDTIKIADQAVTIPSAEFTAAGVTVSATTSTFTTWVDIQTITWTSSGADTLMNFYCDGSADNNNPAAYAFRIYFNGSVLTTLGEVSMEGDNRATANRNFSISRVLSPDSGENTVKIQASARTVGGGNSSATMTNRTLSTLEVKK